MNSSKFDDSSDAEKDNLWDTFMGDMMCPDADSFELMLEPLSGFIPTNIKLSLIVEPKDTTTSETISNSWVQTRTVDRYFSPSVYNERGYLPYIVQDDSVFNLDESVFTRRAVRVSKDDVDYFNLRAFDSSSLSVINLGESFEVYSIEEYETFK